MTKLFKTPSILVALIASIISIAYWGFIATDRYVSVAHVMIQSSNIGSQQSGSVDISSFLGAGGATLSRPDQLLLRDYLMSYDMLEKLNAQLDLRSHYSQESIDLITRMWSENLSTEWFYWYYLRRISIEYDDYSGVLIIKAQGFTPEMANKITSTLVREGELYMNLMAQKLAIDQVNFLQKEAEKSLKRNTEARQALINFQNSRGLVSPEATAENINTIINGLESKLAELRAKRSVMLSYINPTAASVVELDFNIAALENQIDQEKKRLTSKTGKTLNKTVDEYQRLQLLAEFAQELYRSTILTLEKGKLEASRNIKKVSVIQAPTMPQYPLEPRRFFNIAIYVLISFMIAGIGHLIVAIIRDHKD